MSRIKISKKCLACDSGDIKCVYDLGNAPLTDRYRRSKYESLSEPHFPLRACLCLKCGHLQLMHHVDPEMSYEGYLYRSALTQGISVQFNEYAEIIAKMYHADASIKLLDVGSNDGIFIQACLDHGIDAFGVEPSEILASLCNKSSRPTVRAYFSEDIFTALKDASFPDKYSVISFNNVLANMQDPLRALEIARELLLDEKSSIFIQTGYHPVQFKKGLFDWTYHEHFSYFSINSIAQLALRVGLYIKNYQILPLRGGSIRITLTKEEINLPVPYEYYTEEDHFIGMRIFIDQTRSYIQKRIQELRHENYQIYGFGASHSTGILVHHTGISEHLDCLFDDNVLKHGLFMPGTTLQVFGTEELIRKKGKTAVIILSWQYYDLIASKLLAMGYKGKIINPVII